MKNKQRFMVFVRHMDIEKGRRQDAFSCPVALAINRALDLNGEGKFYAQAYVNEAHIRTRGEPGWMAHVGDTYWGDAKLPKEVGDFMVDFDAYLPVKPFQFILVVKKDNHKAWYNRLWRWVRRRS